MRLDCSGVSESNTNKESTIQGTMTKTWMNLYEKRPKKTLHVVRRVFFCVSLFKEYVPFPITNDCASFEIA
ncbi:hypothetical protein PAXY110619_07340 [Paenibacillus xylanexedens]|uniref:Uncharacterized protein n=1 Tax=Paenibacillus xylanexedens TaxID=528191 RepID=A0ABS4RU20_PAEXY|nr:hypothetical protein [Paenibacillus xylanexedens]